MKMLMQVVVKVVGNSITLSKDGVRGDITDKCNNTHLFASLTLYQKKAPFVLSTRAICAHNRRN